MLAHGGEYLTIFLIATHRDETGLSVESRCQTMRKIFRWLVRFHDNIHFNIDDSDAEMSVVFQIENSAPADDQVTQSLRRQIVEVIKQTHAKLRAIPIRYLALEDDVIEFRKSVSVTEYKHLKNKVIAVDDPNSATILWNEYDAALDYLNRSGVVFYCNKDILADYVILDCNVLVQAVRRLLDFAVPSQLAIAQERLHSEGIASYRLIKQAWLGLQTIAPLHVLLKYLEHYGIVYDITSIPSTNADDKEYAVIARLPKHLPADAWAPEDDIESKSVYVMFDRANGVHQSLFCVLLARARKESQRVSGFTPKWCRTAGVFAFNLPDENQFWQSSNIYKLEYNEAYIKVTVR